jgi:hypothetical protein
MTRLRRLAVSLASLTAFALVGAACGHDELFSPASVSGTGGGSLGGTSGTGAAAGTAGSSAGSSGSAGSGGSATGGTTGDAQPDTSTDGALADASTDGSADAASDGPAPVVTDFHLEDVNPASALYKKSVSPRDYLGQVSAWYFGHAT